MVIGIHGAFLGVLSKKKTENPPKIALKRREVKVHFSEIIPVPRPPAQSNKPLQRTALPKKTVKPSPPKPKKKVSKKPLRRTSASKRTPSKNEQKLKEVNRLLNEIQSSSKYQSSESIKLPKKIAPITVGEISSSLSNSNAVEKMLAQVLQGAIILPQKGSAKIRLVLEASGQVVSMQILNCGNSENRQYLESVIPELSFPMLSDTLAEKQQESFEINLVAQ